jgi:hypothetical protein
MAYTDINSEDRLVQATFAEHYHHIWQQSIAPQPIAA